MRHLEKTSAEGKQAVLVVSPAIRKLLSSLIRHHIDDMIILGFTELPDTRKINVVATISGDIETQESQKDDHNVSAYQYSRRRQIMATITVQASDTSTAMEEIALKLGEDAMILSTTKKMAKSLCRHPMMRLLPRNRHSLASTSAISDFDRLFADKLGQELAKPTIDLPAAGAEQRRAPASAGRTSSGSIVWARIVWAHRLGAHRRASAAPSAQPDAIQTHLVSALGLLAEKMEHIEDRLAAMTLTYEGLNPELGDSTPMQLRRSGFSDTIITNLHASFAGLGYEAGVSSFLSHLGQQLAITQSDSLMQKRIYFIVGPSGSGRTTLAEAQAGG